MCQFFELYRMFDACLEGLIVAGHLVFAIANLQQDCFDIYPMPEIPDEIAMKPDPDSDLQIQGVGIYNSDWRVWVY